MLWGDKKKKRWTHSAQYIETISAETKRSQMVVRG
jgi:hypothetical protein